jgi:hypothetical protein
MTDTELFQDVLQVFYHTAKLRSKIFQKSKMVSESYFDLTYSHLCFDLSRRRKTFIHMVVTGAAPNDFILDLIRMFHPKPVPQLLFDRLTRDRQL